LRRPDSCGCQAFPPATKISRSGCLRRTLSDPFVTKPAVNNESIKDVPAIFKVVNVKRELPWDEISDGHDSTGHRMMQPSFIHEAERALHVG
jgi:hypothetical protein